MSTNNQLIILNNSKHKKKPFEVHENLCVDNKFIPNGETILERFETLEEAIKFSNKYQKENIVEYGTRIEDNCLK